MRVSCEFAAHLPSLLAGCNGTDQDCANVLFQTTHSLLTGSRWSQSEEA